VRVLWPAVALVVGAAVGWAVAAALVARAPGRLLVVNHRGREVPAVLGVGFVMGASAGWAIAALWGPGGGAVDLPVIGGMGLVAAAGLLDDVATHHARGFRGHLGSLARGRPTTGILKLLVGVAVGIGLAVLAGGGAVRVVASAVLIVVSVNVWNALDVIPGRALKFGAVALAAVVAIGLGRPVASLGAAGLGAALGVLPLDLSERGMLGDTGSNPLGLLTGLALALVLPTWGVIVAAAAGVAFQVVAETVTISRVIDAVPPLRWFDRTGRRS
jgi:UDP-GlcNAc:undecaprenyl-phosphate/decaprenyl-phosphate GlcNAc-1-phosphate transferase